MPEPLTPEWIAALDEIAAGLAEVDEPEAGPPLVLEQVVVDDDGRDLARWHVTIDRRLRFAPGAADEPTIRLTTDPATARAIATGTESAQGAFMRGALRLGGDPTVLSAERARLVRLADALARAASDQLR